MAQPVHHASCSLTMGVSYIQWLSSKQIGLCENGRLGIVWCHEQAHQVT